MKSAYLSKYLKKKTQNLKIFKKLMYLILFVLKNNMLHYLLIIIFVRLDIVLG